MSATDAARLRADGVPVPTTDEAGTAVLRYHLLALSVIEEDMGTVTEAYERLRLAEQQQMSAPIATVLGTFLRAGLAEPGRIPTAAEALARVELDPRDAVAACLDALAQAFPPASRAEGNGQAAGESTGAAGTTPPQSDGAAQTVSSGP